MKSALEKTKETIASMNAEGFVIFAMKSEITMVKMQGSKMIKKFIPPNCWQGLTKEEAAKSCEDRAITHAFGLITGKVSGLTVIDFDNLGFYNQLVNAHPELAEMRRVQTKKGYHHYFAYDATINNATAITNGRTIILTTSKTDASATDSAKAKAIAEGVDSRNDGGFVFCPPTWYECDKKRVTYTDFGGNKIGPIPSWLKDLFSPKAFKDPVSSTDPTPILPINPAIDSIIPQIDYIDAAKKLKDLEKIQKLINAGDLTPMASSYDDWYRVGQTIWNYDNTVNGLNLFLTFSKQSEAYDEEGCRKKWAELKKRAGRPATITGLLKRIKENNANAEIEEKVEKAKKELEANGCIEIDGDDETAAKVIVNSLNQKIIVCNDVIFLKLRKTNTWTDREIKIERELVRVIMDLKMCTITDDGEQKMFTRNCLNVKKLLGSYISPLIPEDDDFVDNLRKDNVDKLYFKNGIYDFAKKTFRREETDDDKTMVRIKYDFIESSDNEYLAVMESKVRDVINSIFSIKKMRSDKLHPLAINFMQHMARGLAGHYEDKSWLIGLGDRNCGKGILTEMFKAACGGYSGTTDADNFLVKTFRGEAARDKAWLLPYCWCRLLFFNEMSIDHPDSNLPAIINGVLIKTLASGGDEQEGRACYQRVSSKFVFHARMTFFLNQIPKIEPADVLQETSKFQFPNVFVQKSEIKHVNDKERDATLKNRVSDPDFAQAFMHIIIENFVDNKVVNLKEVDNATKELREESGDVLLFFESAFLLTPNDLTHNMTTQEIIDHAAASHIKLTSQVVKLRLANLGCKDDKNITREIDGEKKFFRGYKGICLKPCSDESDEPDEPNESDKSDEILSIKSDKSDEILSSQSVTLVAATVRSNRKPVRCLL